MVSTEWLNIIQIKRNNAENISEVSKHLNGFSDLVTTNWSSELMTRTGLSESCVIWMDPVHHRMS